MSEAIHAVGTAPCSLISEKLLDVDPRLERFFAKHTNEKDNGWHQLYASTRRVQVRRIFKKLSRELDNTAAAVISLGDLEDSRRNAHRFRCNRWLRRRGGQCGDLVAPKLNSHLTPRMPGGSMSPLVRLHHGYQTVRAEASSRWVVSSTDHT